MDFMCPKYKTSVAEPPLFGAAPDIGSKNLIENSWDFRFSGDSCGKAE